MLKKISLSSMVSTYLFIGAAHLLRFDYFLSLQPSFLPYPGFLVVFTGIVEILMGIFLALPVSRRKTCYVIMVFWALSIPMNAYVLAIGGAGIPLSDWVLACRIPFHLGLIAWAYWHSREAVVRPPSSVVR